MDDDGNNILTCVNLTPDLGDYYDCVTIGVEESLFHENHNNTGAAADNYITRMVTGCCEQTPIKLSIRLH